MDLLMNSLLIVSSILHILGELYFKIGSINFQLEEIRDISEMIIVNKIYSLFSFFFFPIIFISLIFSLLSKLVFAILLINQPFTLIVPLFLSIITVLSQIVGRFYFKEKINSLQVIGLVFISLGIFLVGAPQ